MTIFEKIKNTISENHLFHPNSKLLLACSGGMDSIFLFHFLRLEGYFFGVAHFDHQTRHGESALDASFVQKLCVDFEIPFYLKSEDIFSIAKRGSQNFHQVARNFRYSFFNEIVKSKDYDCILTAHHLNDQAETMLMNLNRGGGFRGIKGINYINNNIVRPLLNITREEISKEISSKKWEYREDSSNQETNYERNRLRHSVFPQLESWSPHFYQGLKQSSNILRQEYNFYKDKMEEQKSLFVKPIENGSVIDLKDLKQNKHYRLILFHLLVDFGFNEETSKAVLRSNKSGRLWENAENIMILRKEKLWINNKEEEIIFKDILVRPNSKIYIPNIGTLIREDLPSIDLDGISIPLILEHEDLIIRRWKEGDYMEFEYGKKKLKKLFNELCDNPFSKRQLLCLCYQSQVFWIFKLIKGKSYDTGHSIFFSK